MSGRRHRSIRATTALRVVATVVIVTWLASRVRLERLHDLGWRPDGLLWLAGAVGLTLLGVGLSALRWQRVLMALDRPVKAGILVRHYLASLFVGNVLPSTIGGDVLRVSRLASEGGDAPRVLASVVLERLTGWLVLPMLTLVGLAANPGLRRIAPAPARSALGFAVATVALLAVVLVLASSPGFGRWLGSSQGWRRFIGGVHLGLERFHRLPGLAFEVLTVGFAYQLVMVLAAFLAAKALGVGVGWTVMLAFFPVVAIIQVLPLTVGGLGTREAALIFFLHPFGVPDAHAFALGLLLYMISLAVSLAGAPAFALGNRPDRAVAHG
ncbi:MAG: flippase-like domain-containing protein [Actinomycetota bacterium]|nr:flippase-like domain-containing protein [Actinomycetota bacterium]MDQ3679421.1 flippase-like domain-containing protein [Actinomycetota bacterium]